MVSNLLAGRQIQGVDDESDTPEILQEEFQYHGAGLFRSLFAKTQSGGSLP